MSWEVRYRRGISWKALEAEQTSLLESVKQNPALRYLLVSEPQATYTFGRSANRQDLLLSKSALAENKIQVESVNRGGQWTYHGPGQILVYPLVSLDALGYRKRAVCEFLCHFREGVRSLLRSHAVDAEIGDRPFGLYLDGGKIASFGIAVQRGVISHGMALYLTDQTANFGGIHPCGVPGQTITPLQRRRPSLEWEEVALGLVDHVKKGFKS